MLTVEYGTTLLPTLLKRWQSNCVLHAATHFKVLAKENPVDPGRL